MAPAIDSIMVDAKEIRIVLKMNNNASRHVVNISTLVTCPKLLDHVPANINDTSIANQRNNAPNSNILAVWATTTTSKLLKNVKAGVVEMDHHKIPMWKQPLILCQLKS
uniref:Uncharacterized protein n=1 Tax=Acrobeloides nanus TaxID=290746 RepID=A0A914CIX4_9BILA